MTQDAASPSPPSGLAHHLTTKATDHELQKHDKFTRYEQDLERPIKMNIEAPDIPSQLAPQFRRASARTETNREFREARWASYSDIGAA